MRDVRDQVGHLALRRGHRGDQARAARGLRQRDVEAHVGKAVVGVLADLALHLLREGLERVERRRVRALSREHGDPDLERHAVVADLLPLPEQLLGRQLGGRLGVGDERAAAAPTRRLQLARLAEREQRLAQRRARDAELAAELALGRQSGARREQPELDRGAQSLDRLLERGLRTDRREDRVLADRRGDGHSRSKPR